MTIKNFAYHYIFPAIDDSGKRKFNFVKKGASSLKERDAEGISVGLNTLFNRTGVQIGRFRKPEGILESAIQLVAEESKDYIEFTEEQASRFADIISKVGGNLKGGSFIFLRYQSSYDYLVIAQLLNESGVILSNEYDLISGQILQTNKLYLACRINLTTWNSQGKKPYIHLKSGDSRNVNYFNEFIGFEPDDNSEENTKNLRSAVEDYIAFHDCNKEQKDEVNDKFYEYCTKRTKRGENQLVTLTELSETLDNHLGIDGDERKQLIEIAQSEEYLIPNTFKVYRREITKVKKVQFSTIIDKKVLSFSFDKKLLNDYIDYDEDNGRISFVNVPKSVFDEINR
jgi:nucleoid-associated protein